jgi:uncharacterized protein (DUF427 family)
MRQPARIEPDPGQESVWDYPRPPRIEDTSEHVRVIFGGETIAETRRAKRVLETSGPPTYYIPPDDVRREFLVPTSRTTVCEWKGQAAYFTLRRGDALASEAAWSYPDPKPAFEAIKDYLAFYPGRVEACYVDEERVRPQAGTYYGGWITSRIVGPFKGEPGSELW